MSWQACTLNSSSKSEEDTAWEMSLGSGGGFLINSTFSSWANPQHPMDTCVFILREASSRWNELHDDILVIPLKMLVLQEVCVQSRGFTIKSMEGEAYNGRMRWSRCKISFLEVGLCQRRVHWFLVRTAVWFFFGAVPEN